MKLSPLFWPIKLKDNTIFILDETALPQRLTYLKVKDYKQACLAIKKMKTRSVGQVILVFYIFLQALRQNKNLKLVAKAINSTRPTLPFKFITDIILGWVNKKVPLEEAIPRFLKRLKEARIKQAEEVSKLITCSSTILTHCNVSGLMPLIGEFCRRKNKKITFFVTETRPYLQGSRLTAWELKKAGFAVFVIADNMVAQVMYKGLIDAVIVGSDHLAQNGDIANKIGTYQIAILARHFKLPFYVLCPPPSKTKSGKEIKIEIRPDKELLEFAGKRIAPKGIKGYYPAFDITPAHLITKHIHLDI